MILSRCRFAVEQRRRSKAGDERQLRVDGGRWPEGARREAVGGYLPLATGVSTVRYPIPQRTFKYIAVVHSVTDETCQDRK
jgi:hypothetical protein